MVQSKATTVDEYLAELPPDRKRMVEAIREVVLKNLPAGYEEGMDFGMIGYFIPLKTFPDTYNKHPLELAGIASQKNYVSIYLMSVYSNPSILAWFLDEYKKTGKKLDMGKSCVRFKKLEDIPLELLGEVIARTPVEEFIKNYGKTK